VTRSPTNADFARSIFKTTGFEDIDETWSSGAYIGGLAGAYQDAGIAESYKSAADILVERALVDERVHEVVLPVLLLYRHALELRLKFAVRPKTFDHDLVALARALDEILVTKRGAGLPPALIERIKEISDYDTIGDAFRFHTRKAKKSGGPPQPHFPEEVWVNVTYLRDLVNWLDRHLRDAAAITRAPTSSSPRP
jgi:hypothetical protein